MLHFFRKYQKIFFIIVTVAIVISFTFFGTYQVIAPIFRAKSDESGSYLSQMTRFLASEQWMTSRKIFAANFLNDGVISKEFLESNIADLIVAAYPEKFQRDFEERFEKEKNYLPYCHPYVPTLSAMSIWTILAPDIPAKLQKHIESQGAFAEREALFLAQRQLPPSVLAHILRYQEHNNQIPADPRLAREELGLFGYSNLTDWFGETFIETCAWIIQQTASEARKLGYKVSKDEVHAELVLRSQEAFEGMKSSVNLPINNGYGLLQLYLRQLGIQEETALKIWEDVMLFRRLMHAVGSAALIDPLPLSQFYAFAYENATIELYQMPPECRLHTMDELKRFEAYLAAVGEKKASALDVPLNYASLNKVESVAPELVGKRYHLYVGSTSKQALQAKVSVKETVQWECDPENWKKLVQQFPELAHKTGNPFDILEKMEEKGRRLVDAFARKQIVEAHPEWINEALLNAEMEEKDIFLTSKMTSSFEGITDVQQFSLALDAEDELCGYTQDKQHFYRILVDKKSAQKEILSYKEAVQAKVLEGLVEKMQIQGVVQAVVDSCPAEYKENAYAYRFAPFIEKHHQQFPVGELAQQFCIEKKDKTITRSERSFISLDEVLALEPGVFSSVRSDPVEGSYVYRFIESKTETAVPMDKLLRTQELLSREARCRYFEQLLAQFDMAKM